MNKIHFLTEEKDKYFTVTIRAMIKDKDKILFQHIDKKEIESTKDVRMMLSVFETWIKSLEKVLNN